MLGRLLVFCYAVIRGFGCLGWVFVVLLSSLFLWGMICYFIVFGYDVSVVWVGLGVLIVCLLRSLIGQF